MYWNTNGVYMAYQWWYHRVLQGQPAALLHFINLRLLLSTRNAFLASLLLLRMLIASMHPDAVLMCVLLLVTLSSLHLQLGE
jgi:hypothetical protein